MDFTLTTPLHPDGSRYLAHLLNTDNNEPDLLNIMQQLHESLDPRTVFACFGEIMGQYLPVEGVKLDYKQYQFSWGRRQGIFVKQHLSFSGDTAIVQYSLKSPLMPSQSLQLQLLQTLVLKPLFNAVQFHEMSQQAMYDSLTELGNRHYYTESLKKAIAEASRYQRDMSLVVLDLDKFKQLNDRFGHPFGDTVLQEFGQLLRSAIRDTDCAFRIGGDEFVVLVRGDDKASSILCERILTMMATHPLFKKYQVQTSIGASQWQQGENALSWYDRADKALYDAKAAGRRCYRLDVA